MAELREDFELMRGALGWLLLSAVLAVGLYVASAYFRGEMKEEFNAEHLRFRAISQSYLSVDEEERIIREEYPRFVSLYESGVIGDERRLDWLETVRLAREAVRLPQLDLKLESQAIVDAEFPVSNGAFDLRGSVMHLDMGLLHEGDLLNFLGVIERRAPGVFSVSACSLTRLSKEFDTARVDKNLSASCELTWYTLDLKGNRRVTL